MQLYQGPRNLYIFCRFHQFDSLLQHSRAHFIPVYGAVRYYMKVSTGELKISV